MPTVIPLRPGAAGAYTDTDALNDIHALLTTTGPGNATRPTSRNSWPGPVGPWWPPATLRSP